MKVAVIQLKADSDKKRNIKRALEFVNQAIRNRARFILLPEVFNYRGPLQEAVLLKDIAEQIPGDSTTPFLSLARQHRVFLLLGSIYEKDRRERFSSTKMQLWRKKVFNTSVLINEDGKVAAKYRKIHLFEAVLGKKIIKESKIFLAGDTLGSSPVHGFKVGLSICYDLRFPEIFRRYSKSGCQILTVPSVFTKKTGQAHWETLLRARAIENLCYVLAPNQTGQDGRGVPSYGHSMIIGPWGDILAQASGSKEEIIYAQIKRETVEKVRTILPLVIGNNSSINGDSALFLKKGAVPIK